MTLTYVCSQRVHGIEFNAGRLAALVAVAVGLYVTGTIGAAHQRSMSAIAVNGLCLAAYAATVWFLPWSPAHMNGLFWWRREVTPR